MPLEIITLPPSEWRAYKALRLEALQEAPYAFVATYAENLTRPDSHWQSRLEEAAAGRSVLLFARAGDRLVGLVGAYPLEDDPQTAIVISVYVAPLFRRQGAALQLMEATLNELKLLGFRRAVLMVNAAPPAAYNLYRRLGFHVTGEVSGQAGDGNIHHGYRMEKRLVN